MAMYICIMCSLSPLSGRIVKNLETVKYVNSIFGRHQ